MSDLQIIGQIDDLNIDVDESVLDEISCGSIPLDSILFLFDKAEKSYKESQNITLAIDYQLHNEYHYAARAMATILYTGSTDTNINLAKHHLLMASQHILNDSLDLLIGVLEEKIEFLNNICYSKTIGDCYSEFFEKYNIVRTIKRVISQSRETRGADRIRSYIKLLEEDKISLLADFIETLDKDVRTSLIRERRKEIFSSMGWVIMFLVASISLIVAILK